MKKLLIVCLLVSGLYIYFPGQVLAAPVDLPINRPEIVKIESIPNLIQAVIGILLVIAFIIALVYLLLGGIQWIASGGDKAGVEAAQKKIQAALIGMVVVAAVWALFALVGEWLGINITTLQLPYPTRT